MNGIFWPYVDKFVLVCLYDILICSRTKHENSEHFNTLLENLTEHELYGKISKCDFLKKQIQYLGHVTTENGIQIDKSKITSIIHWELSQNVTQAQSFLSLCDYYSRLIKNFATVGGALSDLTKKENCFQWTATQQLPFQHLKDRLSQSPVLQCADPPLSYDLLADVSTVDAGTVPVLTDELGSRPVAFCSRKLNDAEQG